MSPTDYQNILAELRSPAALHPDSHFLDPELPVTPKLFPVHLQDCRADSPLLSGPQPLPWSPESRPSSRRHDSPPRSPTRPRELVLCVRSADPVPPKVRKPHIALNDQLLLSEEEDRLGQELELSCRRRSQPVLALCEFDTDLVASTSSLSLTSLSSITPSSPERPQGQTAVPGGGQGVRTDKVAGMVATELEGNVEQWLKPDLIENVDRKCEMIMKGGCKGAERAEEEEKLGVKMKGSGRGGRARWEQGRGLLNNPEFGGQTVEGKRFEGDSEENVCQSGKMEEQEWLAGSQSQAWPASEGDVQAEARARVGHHPETGSNEEEEEADAELPGEFHLELVAKGGGPEEEEELRGATPVRLELTGKEMLSPVGWHSDSSSVNVEPPTPGRSVSSDLLDRRER